MSDPLSEALRPYLEPIPVVRSDRANLSPQTWRRLKAMTSEPARPLPWERRPTTPWDVPVFVTDDVPPGLILFVNDDDGVVGQVEIDMGDDD